MDKRTKLIMTAAGVAVLLAMAIGRVAIVNEYSPTIISSTNIIIFIGTIVIISLSVLSSKNPSNPVYNTIFVISNNKYSSEKKLRNLDYYLTKEFKSREKYTQLVNENFGELKMAEVKERTNETAVIIVEFSNKNKYEFNVVKRNKENTLKAAGSWVISYYKKL